MTDLNKQYDTVMIDLDGTLTDSRPGIFKAVRYALENMGEPVPGEEMLKAFIGPPLIDSFERYCGLTGSRGKEALRLYREYYKRQGELENSVYPGVFEMLDRLKAAGKQLVVATSKPEEMAERITRHFGLRPYFRYLAGATMDESRSYKKDVIQYALTLIGADMQSGSPDLTRIVMVGDRNYDCEGAAVFGIDSIGVLYGYGSREELEKAGADYIAATPAETADHILGIL